MKLIIINADWNDHFFTNISSCHKLCILIQITAIQRISIVIFCFYFGPEHDRDKFSCLFFHLYSLNIFYAFFGENDRFSMIIEVSGVPFPLCPNCRCFNKIWCKNRLAWIFKWNHKWLDRNYKQSYQIN